MKTKPILFSGPMVRAILEGRKSQTRRVVKNVIDLPEMVAAHKAQDGSWIFWTSDSSNLEEFTKHAYRDGGVECPFGTAGDLLWVRETWADVNSPEGPAICYRADGEYRPWEEFSESFGPDCGAGPTMDYKAYPGDYTMWFEDLLNRDVHKESGYKWKPSIFMPRWASRLTLGVTNIRVERLQAISIQDALAEGCSPFEPVAFFAMLWDSINGKREGYSWGDNPLVWVVSFKVIQTNIDKVKKNERT